MERLFGLVLVVLVGAAAAHEAQYSFNSASVTTKPSVTLTTYNRVVASNTLLGKGKFGLCEHAAVASTLEYRLRLKVDNTVVFDSAKQPTSLSEWEALTSSIEIREAATFYCVVWSDPNGALLPWTGVLSAELEIPDVSSIIGDGSDKPVVLSHTYDLSGRRGPQTMSLSTSVEPESKLLADGSLDLTLFGDTVRLFVFPENGIQSSVYGAMCRPRLAQMEMMLRKTNIPSPEVPSVKEVGWNLAKLLLPKHLGYRAVKEWRVRQGMANSGSYSAVLHGTPGQELVVRGLTPSTSYTAEVKGTFDNGDPVDMFHLSFVTNARVGNPVEAQWRSIGKPSASRRGNDTLILSIPSKLDRASPKIVQTRAVIFDVTSDAKVKEDVFTTSGVMTVPRVDVRWGFKVTFTTTDESGYSAEFHDRMRIFNPDGKADAMPAIKTGDPDVFRTAKTSLLVRIPRELTGFSKRIQAVAVDVHDAVSGEGLFHNNITRIGDVFITAIPPAASKVYEVTLTVFDASTPPPTFHYTLNNPEKALDSPPIPLSGRPILTLRADKLRVQVPSKLPSLAFGERGVLFAETTVRDAVDGEVYAKGRVGGGMGRALEGVAGNRSLVLTTQVTTDAGKKQPQLIMTDIVYRNSYSSPPLLTAFGPPHLLSLSPTSLTLRFPTKTSADDLSLFLSANATVLVRLSSGSLSYVPVASRMCVGAGDCVVVVPRGMLSMGYVVRLEITRQTPPTGFETLHEYTLTSPFITDLPLLSPAPAAPSVRLWTPLPSLAASPSLSPSLVVRFPPSIALRNNTASGIAAAGLGTVRVVVEAVDVNLSLEEDEEAVVMTEGCACVVAATGEETDVEPLCGIDQSEPPCAAGVALRCVSPQQTPLSLQCPNDLNPHSAVNGSRHANRTQTNSTMAFLASGTRAAAKEASAFVPIASHDVRVMDALDRVLEIGDVGSAMLRVRMEFPGGETFLQEVQTPVALAASLAATARLNNASRGLGVEVFAGVGGVVVFVPHVSDNNMVQVSEIVVETVEGERVLGRNLTTGVFNPVALPREALLLLTITVNDEEFSVVVPPATLGALPPQPPSSATPALDVFPAPPLPPFVPRGDMTSRHGVVVRLGQSATTQASISLLDNFSGHVINTLPAAVVGDNFVAIPKGSGNGEYSVKVVRVEEDGSNSTTLVRVRDQDMLDSPATASSRLPIPAHAAPSVLAADGLNVVVRVPESLVEDGPVVKSARVRMTLVSDTNSAHPASQETTVAAPGDTVVALPASATAQDWTVEVAIDVEYANAVPELDNSATATTRAVVRGCNGRVLSTLQLSGSPVVGVTASGVMLLSCPSAVAEGVTLTYGCDFEVVDLTVADNTAKVFTYGGSQRVFAAVKTHNYVVRTKTTQMKGVIVPSDQYVPFSLAARTDLAAPTAPAVLPSCPFLTLSLPRSWDEAGRLVDCDSDHVVVRGSLVEGGKNVIDEARVYLGTRTAVVARNNGCCGKACRVEIRCKSRTGKRTTMATVVVRPPPEFAVEDPSRPQLYTRNCSTLELHNNLEVEKKPWETEVAKQARPLTYTVTRDDEVVKTGTMQFTGTRLIRGLDEGTTYTVTMRYEEAGSDANDDDAPRNDDGGREVEVVEEMKTDVCNSVGANGVDSATGQLAMGSDFLGQTPTVSISAGEYRVFADCPLVFNSAAVSHCSLQVFNAGDDSEVGSNAVAFPNEGDHLLEVPVKGGVYETIPQYVIDYEEGDIVASPEDPRALPSLDLLGSKSSANTQHVANTTGHFIANVTITNVQGIVKTFSAHVTPGHRKPRDPTSIPHVMTKNQKDVMVRMQDNVTQLPYTFMRVAYEDLADKKPRVVYPYEPNLFGGVGDLNPKALFLDVAPGHRYRLVTMLRNEDGEYHNECMFVTADRNPSEPLEKPVVYRVTTQEAIIFLPRLTHLTRYRVFSVDYDAEGMERRTPLIDTEPGDLPPFVPSTNTDGSAQANGNEGHYMYTRTGLSPGQDYEMAVMMTFGDGRADEMVSLVARTDTDSFPCLVGRPTRAQQPWPQAGTTTSRGFTVEYPAVLTSETPRTYPVRNYTLHMRCLGFCDEGGSCMYPDAPWEQIAQQIPVEDIEAGDVEVKGLSTAGSTWVHASCGEVSSSGWFDMKPVGYEGDPFPVYCQVRSDGSWAKILQIDTQYKPHTGNSSSPMEVPGKVTHNAKLSDEQINAMRGDGKYILRMEAEGTNKALYVETRAVFKDDRQVFGLLEGPHLESTKAGMGRTLDDVPHWNLFDFRFIDTEFTHPNVISRNDDCERFIMGRESFDCFKKANATQSGPVRCLNGGSKCEDNRALSNVELFIYQGEACPNHCNGRGHCINGLCECEKGWSGRGCQFEEDEMASFLELPRPRQPSSLKIPVPSGGKPGFQYQVAMVSFNDWGESDMGIVSENIRLKNEPPVQVDLPWVDDVRAGDPPSKTPSTVRMKWNIPYHNGAPIKAYSIQCSPPPPDTGEAEERLYSTTPAKEWKEVFKGLPTMDPPEAILGNGRTAFLPATQYACRVRACNDEGCSLWSEATKFWTKNEKPEKVFGLSILDVTSKMVTLAWQKPRHNGLPITHYTVKYQTYSRAPANGDCYPRYVYSPLIDHPNCTTVEGLSCTVPGAESGVAYYFKVQAVNCEGRGPLSDYVSVRTPGNLPDAPREFTIASVGEDFLEFEFLKGVSDQGADITHFHIQCDNDTTAAHCLSLPPSAGAPGNLEDHPWCVPPSAPSEDVFAVRGSITKAEADGMHPCSRPADQRYLRVRVPNLRPATTYRCRALAMSSDGYSQPALDPYASPPRRYLLARTSDAPPSSPTPSPTLFPKQAREGHEDEFAEEWRGLCVDGSSLVSCECVRSLSGASLDACKKLCRETANCTAIAFNPGGGGKNCLVYNGETSAYSGSMQTYKCMSYHPTDLYGTLDMDTNTFAVNLRWGQFDHNGRLPIASRVYIMNHTRPWSSSLPLLTRTPQNQVDLERLSVITDIPSVFYEAEQYPALIAETANHTLRLSHLRPDSTFSVFVTAVNEVGEGDMVSELVFQTGFGRPEAPLIPTVVGKSTFWMRLRCTPSRGLDGGSPVTSTTFQMMSGPADEFTDWSTAPLFEYHYGDTFGFGLMSVDTPVTFGCISPDLESSDPFSECLELGAQYSFRCRVTNDVGKSDWSESASFSTIGGPPDTLNSDMVRRVDDAELWQSGTGMKVSVSLPFDNGLSISHCDVQIGGTWNPNVPVLTPSSCDAPICPSVTKTYRKASPEYVPDEDSMEGFKFFRLYVHGSLDQRWCVRQIEILDLKRRVLTPKACKAGVGIGDDLKWDASGACAGTLEYCSQPGQAAGFIEVAMPHPVEGVFYTVTASTSATAPLHWDLRGSRTRMSWHLIHTRVNQAWTPGQKLELEMNERIAPNPNLKLVTAGDLQFLAYVEDDWMLMLSYRHEGLKTNATNAALNPHALPVSPQQGYSHSHLARFNLTQDNVTAIRLECFTTNHDRVLAFQNANPAAVALALNASANQTFAWSSDGITKLDGNTGHLPDGIDAVTHSASAGLWNLPFGSVETNSWWGVRAEGDRWECDDGMPAPRCPAPTLPESVVVVEGCDDLATVGSKCVVACAPGYVPSSCGSNAAACSPIVLETGEYHNTEGEYKGLDMTCVPGTCSYHTRLTSSAPSTPHTLRAAQSFESLSQAVLACEELRACAGVLYASDATFPAEATLLNSTAFAFNASETGVGGAFAVLARNCSQHQRCEFDSAAGSSTGTVISQRQFPTLDDALAECLVVRECAGVVHDGNKDGTGFPKVAQLVGVGNATAATGKAVHLKSCLRSSPVKCAGNSTATITRTPIIADTTHRIWAQLDNPELMPWEAKGVGCLATSIDSIDFTQWETLPSPEARNFEVEASDDELFGAVRYPAEVGLGFAQTVTVVDGHDYVITIGASSTGSRGVFTVTEFGATEPLLSFTLLPSGQKQTKRFTPTQPNVTLAAFFPTMPTVDDNITLASVHITRECVEQEGADYVSPSACVNWMRLFTAAGNDPIPKKLMASDVFALGKRVLRVTENEDGSGATMYIRDPSPRFITDPGYQPSSKYESLEASNVICTTTELWKGPFAGSGNVVSGPDHAPLWSGGSVPQGHPCDPEASVRTFWICADPASQNIEAEECVNSTRVTFRTTKQELCASEERPTYVTATGQLCPEGGKIKWNSFEVVDPKPGCAADTMRRSEHLNDPNWQTAVLGSGPHQACGTPPTILPGLPNTKCSFDAATGSAVSVHVDFTLPPEEGSPIDCVEVCRATSDPRCLDTCDADAWYKPLIPSNAYFVRAACSSRAGRANWSGWQRMVSSLGQPSEPLLLEQMNAASGTSVALKWLGPEHPNGAPIAYHEVMMQCVRGLACDAANEQKQQLLEQKRLERSQQSGQQQQGEEEEEEEEEEVWDKACSAECLGGDPRTCLTCTVHCLFPSTTYRFRVRASNGARLSELSDELVVTTAAGLPLPPLPVDASRGSAGDGRYLSDAVRAQLPRILNAQDTCDYSDLLVATSPLTADLSTPSDPVEACVMDADSFKLQASWQVGESDMGSAVTEYIVSVTSKANGSHAEGSPFKVPTQGSGNSLFLTAELGVLLPSVEYSVEVQARNANGLGNATTHICDITAPAFSPCWDGWNPETAQCRPLTQESAPKLVESKEWEFTVEFAPPVAQNAGNAADNVYQLQWGPSGSDNFDLCTSPDHIDTPACADFGDVEVLASELGSEANSTALSLRLTEGDGVRVAQGSEDGMVYKARVRVQEQCEPRDPSELEVSYHAPQGQAACELVRGGFEVNAKPYPDRIAFRIATVDAPASVRDHGYLLKCPWSMDVGTPISLTLSQPATVFAATRMRTASEPFCAAFDHAGFVNDSSVSASVRSGELTFPFRFQSRTYPQGNVQFTYSVSDMPRTQQGMLPLGCNEDDGAFSWFVIAPVTGSESCGWTPWTKLSEDLPVRSRCKYGAEGKCSLRGVCNETTGFCACNPSAPGHPSYGGTACDVQLTDAVCKCVGDPHCTTPDGQFFDYSGGGEYSLVHSDLRPDERIHVVLVKVNHVTAIGKVAFAYKGDVITVETHAPKDPLHEHDEDSEDSDSGQSRARQEAEAQRSCPTVRVNCKEARVEEDSGENPTFAIRAEGSFGGEGPLEIKTVNQDGSTHFCNGNEGEFTIRNRETSTELYCRRWGLTWEYGLSCYLSYTRNVDNAAARASERGLCAYTGERDAQFKGTKWERTIKVTKDNSLFTNAYGEYCVSTQSYCHTNMVWVRGGAVKCHDMEGQVWLQEAEHDAPLVDGAVAMLDATEGSERVLRVSGGVYDASVERPPVHKSLAPGVFSLPAGHSKREAAATTATTHRVAPLNDHAPGTARHSSVHALPTAQHRAVQAQQLVQEAKGMVANHRALQPPHLVEVHSLVQQDQQQQQQQQESGQQESAAQEQEQAQEEEEEEQQDTPEQPSHMDLDCPVTCKLGGNARCVMAKSLCNVEEITDVPSAYLGCLADVCLKNDAAFVELARVDARITLRFDAVHSSLSTTSSTNQQAGPSHLPTELACPDYSYGKEIWNMEPYVETTPFWTSEQVHAICCSVADGNAPAACASVLC